MTLSRLIILFAALVLTACATPTPYKPADSQGEAGYTDQRLTENRVRVIFRGNSATLRETVENYLLLRSAEVTREAGYSWFEFDTRNTQADTNYYTDFIGWPGWHRFGRFRHSWAFDSFGRVATTRAVTQYEASAEIVLLTTAQAKNQPEAIRADDVIAHLAPSAVAPKAN
jgi:hypothetical protein